MTGMNDHNFKQLIQDLQTSKDYEVRKQAAKILGKSTNPLAIEPLLIALSDRDEDVRSQVIKSLANIGDPCVVTRICGLLSDCEPKVRIQAIKALFKLKAFRSLPEIYLRTFDPDWGVKNWAIKTLHQLIDQIITEKIEIDIRLVIGLLRTNDTALLQKIEKLFLCTGDEFLSELLETLESGDAQQKIAICHILSKLGKTEAVFPLINIIRDRNRNVRKAVLYALGELKHEEAISPLIRSLGDTNSEVRKEAIGALTKFNEAAVLPLVRALIMSRDSYIRQNAALTLGEIKDKRAVSALIASLGDSYFSVRNAVEQALLKYGEPIAERLLPLLTPIHYNLEVAHQLLDSPLANERLKGIEILSELRDPHATKILQHMLNDPYAKVQEKAQKALFRLGCYAWARTGSARLLGQLRYKEAIPVLIKALNDKDKDVRIETIHSLGHLRATEAVPELIPLLKDEVTDIRIATAWSLGRIGHTDSVQALIETLEDPDSIVRHNSIVALGKLLNPDATIPLMKLLNTSSYRQKEAVINALKNIGKRAIPVIMKSIEEKDVEMINAVDEAIHFIKDDFTQEIIDEILPSLSEKQQQNFLNILKS